MIWLCDIGLPTLGDLSDGSVVVASFSLTFLEAVPGKASSLAFSCSALLASE